MISIVNGDLMTASEDIIGHQVNCQMKMNSGVAKQIRTTFPQAYEDYMSKSSSHPLELLGQCQMVHISDNKYIANLFGQLNYGYDGGQYTNYQALTNALTYLRRFAAEKGLSVALPFKIGSDRGGADWSRVYEIINEVFNGYRVTLYRL